MAGSSPNSEQGADTMSALSQTGRPEDESSDGSAGEATTSVHGSTTAEILDDIRAEIRGLCQILQRDTQQSLRHEELAEDDRVIVPQSFHNRDWKSKADAQIQRFQTPNEDRTISLCKRAFGIDMTREDSGRQSHAVPVLSFWLRPAGEDDASHPEPMRVYQSNGKFWCERRSQERFLSRLEEQREHSIDYCTQYYPNNDMGPQGIYSARVLSQESGPYAPGLICVMVDCEYDYFRSKTAVVAPESDQPKIMAIASVLQLARSLFGDHMDEDTYTEDAQCSVFESFLLSFSDLYHPSADHCLCNVLAEPIVTLQHLMSHFSPVDALEISPTSVRAEGLQLRRQIAKISRATHAQRKDRNRLDAAEESSDQYFTERVLGAALVMSSMSGGAFQLVILGDNGAPVEINIVTESLCEQNRLQIDFVALGKLAGLAHFLITIVFLADTWYKGWQDTMDTIDDIVGFIMDDTLDDRKVDSYMYDNSSEMELSTQYFTVQQLLRMSRKRIADNLHQWEAAFTLDHGTTDKIGRDIHMREHLGDKALKIWVRERQKVTEMLQTMTGQLLDRIDEKSSEVKSLQETLFNATSVREAMRSMALNRAIYAFTFVTIIYTPLSFIAALWALPVLNTTAEGENSWPSAAAIGPTFVIIPLLTYVPCVLAAWHSTSPDTWYAYQQKILNLPNFLKQNAAGPKTKDVGQDIPLQEVRVVR